MKLLPLALVIALLFAGCLQQPPDSTPDIHANTTTTTTVTPTEPTSPGHPGGGALIRPAHEENESKGFRLVGDESASGFYPGGTITFSFVGTNVGAAAEVLFDPCGAGNPRMWIEDENGTRLELQPPQMHCMAAMGFGPFAANASVEANLTWNGTAYHGDDAYVAPAGSYRALGEFEAKRDGAIVDVRVILPFSIVDQPGVL